MHLDATAATPEMIRDAFMDPEDTRSASFTVRRAGEVVRLIAPSLASIPLGLHADMPASIYHQRTAGVVSRTALSYFGKSPAHYKAWVDGDEESEETAALAFGKALHCAILEPHVFLATYACEPDFGSCRKNDADGTTTEQGRVNKALRDAWREEHADFEIVTFASMQLVVGMAEAVRRHPFAQKLISGGVAEHTALWEDPETGLRCKARADYSLLSRGTLVDIKTTVDSSPEAFSRDVYKYGYHAQAAHYLDGFNACGAGVESMVFLVVEKAAPHVVSVYMLDEGAMLAGRAKNGEAMRRLAQCIELDEWPGYVEDITVISLPPWAK